MLPFYTAESETYLVYTPSMVQSTTQMQTDVFIAVSIPGGILLLFVVLLVTIMMLLLIRMRPKKGMTYPDIYVCVCVHARACACVIVIPYLPGIYQVNPKGGAQKINKYLTCTMIYPRS